jgi:hypothetical protein
MDRQADFFYGLAITCMQLLLLLQNYRDSVQSNAGTADTQLPRTVCNLKRGYTIANLIQLMDELVSARLVARVYLELNLVISKKLSIFLASCNDRTYNETPGGADANVGHSPLLGVDRDSCPASASTHRSN